MTTLLDKLTQEDWQYIAYATEQRIQSAKPRPGEPPGSPEFKQQSDRIMAALYAMAYPRK